MDLKAGCRVDLKAECRVDLKAGCRVAQVKCHPVPRKWVHLECLDSLVRHLSREVSDSKDQVVTLDLKAGCRVDLKAECRVDLKVVCRVDFKAVCRVDLKVECRVDLKVECRVDLKVECLVDLKAGCRVAQVRCHPVPRKWVHLECLDSQVKDL